jgi:hypothetical protein
MKRGLSVVTVAAAFACLGPSAEDAATQQNNPRAPSAIELTVTLIELSEAPTLVGIPERFAIDAPRLPAAGESVTLTWRALDGDPAAEPRQGSGSLAITADGAGLSIALDANAQPSTATLTMTGTIAGGSAGGSFIDRLFSPRAGKFTADIQ